MRQKFRRLVTLVGCSLLALPVLPAQAQTNSRTTTNPYQKNPAYSANRSTQPSSSRAPATLPNTRASAAQPRALPQAKPGTPLPGAAQPADAAPAAPNTRAMMGQKSDSRTDAASKPAPAPEAASGPSVEQALRLAPVQTDVDYSQPKPDEIAQCKITAQKIDGHIGWVVEDAQGNILRKFIDTNGDNKVDQWCYYKDGLEVYRDIDSDFNGKADQYRWFHTGGSRWAVDKDEDGTIDAWTVISAEEVTAEVVAALAKQDAARLQRLLLTSSELRSLGLGDARTKELADKVDAAPAKFKEILRQQKVVKATSKWAQFSGNQPGIVPAGTDGSTKDLQVYENVMAIVQTDATHGQIQIGTLVKAGDLWRLIDVPQPIAEGQADLPPSGIFFRVAQRNPAQPQTSAAANAPDEKSQQILAELEKLDKAAAQAASPSEQAKLHGQRADLLDRIIAESTKPEDRAMWLKQLADMLSAAAQTGAYPDGAKRLEALFEKVQKSDQDKEITAYVRFRQLSADYALAIQAKGADFAKIQTEWLKNLEQFVGEYPKSPDAAEAMLQLAIAQEFAGQEEQAKKWYGQIVSDFGSSSVAKKAAGARTRLESVGKVIEVQGKGPNGQLVDLAKFRGRVVLIQYWATWCEPCKADMAVLKELVEKYGRGGFAVIGVNLDNSVEAMRQFLSENRLPWPQVYEDGGLESRPALDLGILTLPTMILVDQDGKVVNRNITTTELTAELKKLAR